MDCGGIQPVVGNSRCGTLWGPDPNYVNIPGVAVKDTVFAKMTQFLGADPNRIGLYLKSALAGVRVTNQKNGQGVSIMETMGVAPNAGGQFEVMLWAGPGMYLGSPWFTGIADVIAPPGPTSIDQWITWVEFFKA